MIQFAQLIHLNSVHYPFSSLESPVTSSCAISKWPRLLRVSNLLSAHKINGISCALFLSPSLSLVIYNTGLAVSSEIIYWCSTIHSVMPIQPDFYLQTSLSGRSRLLSGLLHPTGLAQGKK